MGPAETRTTEPHTAAGSPTWILVAGLSFMAPLLGAGVVVATGRPWWLLLGMATGLAVLLFTVFRSREPLASDRRFRTCYLAGVGVNALLYALLFAALLANPGLAWWWVLAFAALLVPAPLAAAQQRSAQERSAQQRPGTRG